MNIRYVTIILLCFSTACSNHTTRNNSKETPEVTNRFSNAVAQYNNQVITPILYLVSSTCFQRHTNGKWPSFIEPTAENGLFEKYTILKMSPTYSAKYSLKGRNQFWYVNLDYTSKSGDVGCVGSIIIKNIDDKELFTMPINLNIPKLNKSLATPYEELQNEMEPLSLIILLAVTAAENENNKSRATTNDFFPIVAKVVIAASICALLDSDPHQCPIGLSYNKSASKNNNDKVQQGLKNKLKQLFNENN